jgi:hypothetical protein
MRRSLRPISALLISASLAGCVSAKQRLEEQQQVERSIRTTSQPEAIEGCDFIMTLRPDGLHSTPEAQAASLVLPKPGISWVIFGVTGSYELYSCKVPQEQQERAPTSIPVAAKPTVSAPPPFEATVTPARSDSAKDLAEVKARPSEQPTRNAFKMRVTNNPEAVKGCKFLASFLEYQKVSGFQDDVGRAGGNIGYVVAANQSGDVIGEAYFCSEDSKP